MTDDNEDEMREIMHKVILGGVENQLKDKEFPEVKITLERLMEKGCTRHESIHKLGKVLLEEIYEVERDQRYFDKEKYIQKLFDIE